MVPTVSQGDTKITLAATTTEHLTVGGARDLMIAKGIAPDQTRLHRFTAPRDALDSHAWGAQAYHAVMTRSVFAANDRTPQ